MTQHPPTSRPSFRPAPIELACLLAGLALLLRYRWLMDDAFVYFRYADNFLFLKIGLVYNQYEYVEGFSSPAWMLLLTALRAARLDYWHIVLGVGCAAFTAFWFLLVRLNREMADSAAAVVNLPLVVLSAAYGPLCYFTSGLETALVQVLAVAYALFVLHPSSLPLQIALAASPLIRPELALPLLLCAVWSWRRRGRLPVTLIGLTLVLNGAWVLFRIGYYADLLPNTFYLKDTVDLGQGFLYLHETLWTYHGYFIAILGAIGVALATRDARTRDRLRLLERAMMLVVAASVAAYVVKIGGDARHYRYLAFSFPLALAATAGVPEILLERFGLRRQGVAVPLALLVFALVFVRYPPQLDRHPVTLKEDHRIANKITDASFHRHHPGLVPENWRGVVTIERLEEFRRSRPDALYTNTLNLAWCGLAYKKFDARVVHSLGLTDAFLARTDVPANRPAHKLGLIGRAKQLVQLQLAVGWVGRGMFRHALKERSEFVPGWVRPNLIRLEVIEQKIYNRHYFPENLRLALRPTERIDPW